MPEASIVELIQQDISTLEDLTQLMQQEQSALENNDSEALQQAVSAKIPLLQLVEKNAALRSQLLQSEGFSTDNEGMLKWAENQSDNSQACALWKALQKALEACQSQNEVNGLIVQRSQKSLQELLQIYRGQSQSSVNLYAKSGTQSFSNENKSITKA